MSRNSENRPKGFFSSVGNFFTKTIPNFIDDNFGINAVDRDGNTRLTQAILKDDNVTANRLIDRGANVNKQCRHLKSITPLAAAAIIDNTELADKLLDKGADVNGKCGNFGTALYYAAGNGNADLVDKLLIKGANISYNGVADAESKWLPTKKGLHGDRVWGTPLSYAVSGGKTGNVNNNHLEVVKKLLKKVTDQNDKNEALLQPVPPTAMDVRCQIALELIKSGADVNAKNKQGRTPLYYALHGQGVLEGKEELILTLLKNGADVNVKDNDGKTIFERATDPSIKKILYDHKHNLEMRPEKLRESRKSFLDSLGAKKEDSIQTRESQPKPTKQKGPKQEPTRDHKQKNASFLDRLEQERLTPPATNERK